MVPSQFPCTQEKHRDLVPVALAQHPVGIHIHLAEGYAEPGDERFEPNENFLAEMATSAAEQGQGETVSRFESPEFGALVAPSDFA